MIQVPTWFYVFSGILLVLTGALQIAMRSRDEGIARFIGAGALFSYLCVALGVATVLYGLFGRA